MTFICEGPTESGKYVELSYFDNLCAGVHFRLNMVSVNSYPYAVIPDICMICACLKVRLKVVTFCMWLLEPPIFHFKNH
jgi:hypothetical protein